jgi:hypothetical protein
MIHDWWMAHRFEFLVDFGLFGVVIVGLVIYWFLEQRRNRR